MKTLQEDILSKLKKIKEEKEEIKDGCGSKNCKNCRIQNKKMAPDCFEKNDVRKECFDDFKDKVCKYYEDKIGYKPGVFSSVIAEGVRTVV